MRDILIEAGFWDRDVIYDGKLGRLKLLNNYSPIKSDIYFAPYKKNGDLSMNTTNLYIWPGDREEMIAELKNVVKLPEQGLQRKK